MRVHLELEPLLIAARAGDPEALEAVCSRLLPRVRELVHRSMAISLRRQRPWLAALFSTGDVVQDVFVSVLERLEKLHVECEEAFTHYLATLTRNRLVDAIRFFEAARRDRRRDEVEGDAIAGLDDGRESPEEAAITYEEILRFDRALASFSERDRTLLRERIENRTPYEELHLMLGFATADSTRKAFRIAQAKLLARLQRGAE